MTDENDVVKAPGLNHRLWAIPLVIAMGLLSLLAASYLGGVLNPQENLHDFPLVLVNADQGEYGPRVAREMRAALPPDRVALRETDAAAAEGLLALGNVYGAIMIPEDFSARLTALEQPAGERGTPPVIEIRTNPRAGALGVQLTVQLLTPVLGDINTKLGTEVSARAAGNGVPLSDAALVTLADPVRVSITQYRPLPPGTGNGLSAFYYTLLLVLAGFTGSMLVSTGIDAVAKDRPNLSTWRVLQLKWALAAVVAMLMAGIYQLIAVGLGMPISHHLTLYCYCVFAAFAVGVTALSITEAASVVASALRTPILAIIAMPINMLLFIALGLPSSGGIIPIQAAPRAFQALSSFEPMHQIFLGIRSILYFDARADAGLSHALIMCTLGLVVGVVLGLLATLGYQRFRTRPRRDRRQGRFATPRT